MKEILIRNLDSPSKKDISSIITDYIQRDYVETSAYSTAVEQLIREFSANENTIENQRLRIRELEAKVKQLTKANHLFSATHRRFVTALTDLVNLESLPS